MSWSSHPTVPTRGWNQTAAGATRLQNPRTPAVPATLDLTLEEYFAAAAVVGLLSAQFDEPDMDWVVTWALEFGARMAKDARLRRDAHRPRPRKV